MKKISLSLLSICFSFFLLLNSCQHQPTNSGQPEGHNTRDTVGSPAWNITIVVKDGNQRLVDGASVTLPCAGLSQNTNSSGTTTFTGEGNCPCNADNSATVSKKGMCSNIVVPLTNGCGATYSAICQ